MKRHNAAGDRTADQADAVARRTAADRIQKVVILATPYAQQAAGRVGPAARAAGQHGARSARGALNAVGPRLDEAYVRLTPVVVAARGRVNDELLPRVGEAWVAASGSPVLVEFSKRGRAALAAARGELALPDVASTRTRTWPKRLAVFVGAAGVGVVAARKLLNLKGTGEDVRSDSSPVTDVATPAPGPDTDAAGAAGVTEPVATRSGTGVYVGTEPPAEFTIKGDESSLTYRTLTSSGYAASHGDVWFDSEASAHQAGFTAAQD